MNNRRACDSPPPQRIKKQIQQRMRAANHLFLLLLLFIFENITGCLPPALYRRSTPLRSEPLAASHPNAHSAPIHPSLGLIEEVFADAGFVLINIGTAPAPSAGTRLQAFSGSMPHALLVVSTHQKRPFLIADILSGTPTPGNSVSLIFESASSVTEKPIPPEGRIP